MKHSDTIVTVLEVILFLVMVYGFVHLLPDQERDGRFVWGSFCKQLPDGYFSFDAHRRGKPVFLSFA